MAGEVYDWPTDLDPGVGHWLETFIEVELAPERVERWVAALNATIMGRIPEIAADPVLVEELTLSSRSHWVGFLNVVAQPGYSEHVPQPAADFALTVARRGLDLDVLLKVYRVALDWVWTYATTLVEDLAPDGPDPTLLLVGFWSRAGHWINHSIEDLIGIYAQERNQLVQSEMARRAEIIDAVLEGTGGDAAQLSAELEHPLTPFQTAFVLWTSVSADFSRLERLAVRVSDELRSTQPLWSRHGSRELWCWVASRRPPRLQRIDAIRHELAKHRVSAAFGGPTPGIEGFRVSHGEALAAQRLALAAPAPPSLVRYTDVELVAQLARDPAAAERYVHRVLGELAGDGRGMDRLRETLHAMLTTSATLDELAADMNLHKNTLRYRVGQAEEKLGYRVAERRGDLETALRYLDSLGRL